MWKEFRRRAFPLLGEHFPPNLIKDNGDSIVFVDRRERLRFLLTESTQGITIGDYEERNTVGIICTSPSIELATIARRCQWVVAMSSLNASVGVR